MGSNGERFYQKKVVEEGPGFVHVQVTQASNVPGAGAQQQNGLDGFLGMMAMVME